MLDSVPINTHECQPVISLELQHINRNNSETPINMKDVFTSDYWIKSEHARLSRRYLITNITGTLLCT